MDGQSIADVVATWRDFYVAAATVAATLLGLLFVAVSLHLPQLTDPARGGLRSLASQTQEGFLFVIMMSLFFLIPGQTVWGLVIPLAVIPPSASAGSSGIRDCCGGWRKGRPAAGCSGGSTCRG